MYVCMCLSMRIYRLNIHSIKTDVPRQIVSLIYQFKNEWWTWGVAMLSWFGWGTNMDVQDIGI